MLDPTATVPDALYERATEVPLNVDLGKPGWTLVNVEGARKRGWIKGSKPPAERIREWTRTEALANPEIKVEAVVAAVKEKSDAIDERDVLNALNEVVRSGAVGLHGDGLGAQEAPPDFVHGEKAVFATVAPTGVLITNAEAAKRGWIEAKTRGIELFGADARARLLPQVKRLGELYAGGAKSPVSYLGVVNLAVAGGGRLTLKIENATPEAMKALDELFDVLMTAASVDVETEATIEIATPEDGCKLAELLRKEPT
jgi:hypothetical protein